MQSTDCQYLFAPICAAKIWKLLKPVIIYLFKEKCQPYEIVNKNAGKANECSKQAIFR
jgi:hypothetical protein